MSGLRKRTRQVAEVEDHHLDRQAGAKSHQSPEIQALTRDLNPETLLALALLPGVTQAQNLAYQGGPVPKTTMAVDA